MTLVGNEDKKMNTLIKQKLLIIVVLALTATDLLVTGAAAQAPQMTYLDTPQGNLNATINLVPAQEPGAPPAGLVLPDRPVVLELIDEVRDDLRRQLLLARVALRLDRVGERDVGVLLVDGVAVFIRSESMIPPCATCWNPGPYSVVVSSPRAVLPPGAFCSKTDVTEKT